MLRNLLVDDRVVMLQIGAETLGLERDPESELVHAAGLLGPGAEMVCILRKPLTQVLARLGVFVEEDLLWICQTMSIVRGWRMWLILRDGLRDRVCAGAGWGLQHLVGRL